METIKKKLAVIFPGIGYHKDKPLLYYATKLVQSHGYEVIHIEYHDMPVKIKGDAAMMRKAAEIAFAQTEEQLREVAFSEYEDVLLIGKSIGTVALAKYVSDHNIKAKQIWYTPVEATFSFPGEEIIAFIGDADPWSDVGKITQRADELGIKLYSYPGCNHSLETGNVLTDTANIHQVMDITEKWINE
jgi:phosphoglycolate phosphatase